jgi:hypothetical protein
MKSTVIYLFNEVGDQKILVIGGIIITLMWIISMFSHGI